MCSNQVCLRTLGTKLFGHVIPKSPNFCRPSRVGRLGGFVGEVISGDQPALQVIVTGLQGRVRRDLQCVNTSNTDFEGKLLHGPKKIAVFGIKGHHHGHESGINCTLAVDQSKYEGVADEPKQSAWLSQ